MVAVVAIAVVDGLKLFIYMVIVGEYIIWNIAVVVVATVTAVVVLVVAAVVAAVITVVVVVWGVSGSL